VLSSEPVDPKLSSLQPGTFRLGIAVAYGAILAMAAIWLKPEFGRRTST
jgi:hypothetical protein